MTVREALREGQSILFYAEVETPALDATVLLAEALGMTKERLLAALPEVLPTGASERYRHFLDLRCSGIPVSYIRGRKEFFSLEFLVDCRVLVPRPDTETLVEEALRLARENPGLRRVHDACTGSGCVAVALAHAAARLEVSASDLSISAQEVFLLNCRRLLGRLLPFTVSDLLEEVPGPFDMITANPPYLTEAEAQGMRKVGWPEPELALCGGADGMQVALRLIGQAGERLASGGFLLLEAAPPQVPCLEEAMSRHGFDPVWSVPDLAGFPRVAVGRRGRIPRQGRIPRRGRIPGAGASP